MLAATPAIAACDTTNTYRFDWNSQAQAVQTYGTTYNYSAANAVPGAVGFSVRSTAAGQATPEVAGVQTPVVAAINEATTGTGQFTYTIGGRFNGRTESITGTTNVVVATFTFPTAVRDLSFRVHDIDFRTNEYRDWVRIVGRNGATIYFPTITKPVASTVRIGPNATAPAIVSGELLGASESQEEEDIGAVTVAFAQPVTSVEIRYGNYPLQSVETATGQQWISVYDLSFCPMPRLSITKSSTPFATSGADRFNAPGADVVYTITAANSGGSPVDLAGLTLADLLPAQTSFYNGDFDTAAPGTDPFKLTAGSSGVTLAASGVAYSNDGGSSYAYTPATGYDAAVNAVRFAPGGSMAANSSFSISFRARIK
jgi:uncharacterized repeat protein (TIGR01451 family)